MGVIVNSVTAVAAAASGGDNAAKQFGAVLVAAISAGQQRLPPWSPETERLRRMLATDSVKPGQWSKSLSSSPHMVVKIMQAASSPLFGRAVRARAELKDAVAHLGHKGMLCLVYANALAQVRNAPRLQHLRPALIRMAESSANAAAVAWLVAKENAGLSPDDAMLAGLLHNVGKLCLLANLDVSSELYTDLRKQLTLLASSHKAVAVALIRQFELPAWLAAAIAVQEQDSHIDPTQPLINEVLAAAVVAARTVEAVEETAAHLASFKRLGLDSSAWRALLRKVPATANAMRELFSE
jgi:HD-like signal output (HDOD) protein